MIDSVGQMKIHHQRFLSGKTDDFKSLPHIFTIYKKMTPNIYHEYDKTNTEIGAIEYEDRMKQRTLYNLVSRGIPADEARRRLGIK